MAKHLLYAQLSVYITIATFSIIFSFYQKVTVAPIMQFVMYAMAGLFVATVVLLVSIMPMHYLLRKIGKTTFGWYAVLGNLPALVSILMLYLFGSSLGTGWYMPLLLIMICLFTASIFWILLNGGLDEAEISNGLLVFLGSSLAFIIGIHFFLLSSLDYLTALTSTLYEAKRHTLYFLITGIVLLVLSFPTTKHISGILQRKHTLSAGD